MTLHTNWRRHASILAGLTAIAMLSLAPRTHGPAEWIQRGGYKNAARRTVLRRARLLRAHRKPT